MNLVESLRTPDDSRPRFMMQTPPKSPGPWRDGPSNPDRVK